MNQSKTVSNAAQESSAAPDSDANLSAIIDRLVADGVTLATTGRHAKVRQLLDELPRDVVAGNRILRELAILLAAVEGNLTTNPSSPRSYIYGRIDEASVILDCLPALNSADRPLPGSGAPSLGAAWPMTRLVWALRVLLSGDMRGARLAFQELAWVSADMPVVELLRLNGVAYCLLREGRPREAGPVFAEVADHMVAHDLQTHPISFIVDAATGLWWATEGNQDQVSSHRAAALSKMARVGPVLGMLKVAVLTTLAQADLTIGDLRGCEELLRRAGSPQRKTLTPHLRRRIAGLWSDLEAARRETDRAALITPSQARVLSLMETPMTVPEIATSMGISPATVRTHVRALYARYGVSRRSELVKRANGASLGARRRAAAP